MKLDLFGMFFNYLRVSRLFSRWASPFILLTLASVAQANPVGISVSGRIVDDATNIPLSGSVSFRVKVLTKNNCILYSEEFNSYTVPATGTFTFTLGKGSSPVNAYHPGNPVAAQSALGMNNIFSNAHTASVSTLGEGGASGSSVSSDNVACGGAGVAYTPLADDFRKVRIEFDDGDGQGYKTILPYHQIRTVPYAMLAEEANNALKLGGSPAADYAKLTDIPDLATGVPAAETDPSVKAFAKANISGLTAGSCAAGQVLSYNGTALVCVADAGGSSTPIATSTVVGTVMVPNASYVSLAGTGEIDVKDLPISKITNLQTTLNGTLKVADMPAVSCAAGEALIWSSPSNVFSCNAITIDAAHVSDFNTAVDARITAGNTASPKLPLAGGTMTGDITMGSHDVLATGHITMSNQKTITIGKYDQTQENTLAGTLNGANEGATWYNSAMKALRFWDGSARQTVVSTTGACTDGQILKWNDTTKVWACAADSGGASVDASYAAKGVVQFNTDADTSGVTVAAGVATLNTGTAANQIVKLDGTAKLPAVDGSALTNLTVVVDKITSAAGKYFGYMPNNVACADGEVLKWNNGATRWECGADAGAGGADASSIRGKTIAASVGTPAAGSFLTYDNATTSWVASVFTDCTAAGSAIHYNATLNTWSCDALTIARNKVASGTAYRIVANDATGVMSDAAAITASRALISDANGIPTHSTVTATELGYVSGVTSAIQTQIDGLTTGSAGKVAKAGDTMTGNLVMNAQKEVRFADSDSSNFIGLKSPATVASDVTFTLPDADGTAGYVLKTNGAGVLSWVAQTAAPSDASYAAKGIVQFNTDADTSGVTVAAGVATINSGTAANQIVKLDTDARLPAVDGSQLTNITRVQVPASSTMLMASCPGGWTDNGATTGAHCNGAACRMCQSPASVSSIPASTVIKMETCPAGWTGLGYDTGPNAAGFDTVNFVNCQSPGSVSKLPLNARMIMPSCPAQWNDLGATGPVGPLVATCSGVACRVCEVPGAQMPSHIAASTAGNVVLTGGAGGGTNLTGGAVNINGGAGGVSNGNGGNVMISGGAADGSGTIGNVLLAPSIGKVAIGLGGAAPAYPLDVNGDVNITGVFRVNGTAIGSGTVTSVSSANADIGVSMASPTPVLTLNSGTGANQIVKLDASSKLPAVDGSALTNLNAGNIASGVLPVTRGGTGASVLAANRLIGMNSTGTVQEVVTCALNQILSFDVAGNYGCYAVSSIYSGFVNGGNTFGATSSLGNSDNFDLNIKTNNLNRLTVQAGGNVGIGTTTPAALLDVNGAITAASVTASSLSGSNIYGAYLGLNGSNNGGMTMGIENSAATGYSGAYFTDEGGAMQGAVGHSNSAAGIVTNTVFLASLGTKPLVLATNSVERIRVLSTGAVGIGTSTPNSGLQVTGNSGGWTVAGWPKNIQVGADGGAGLIRFPFNNSNQPAIGSSTDGVLRFMHSGAIDATGALSTDMVIMPSGNVGIGTTNPLYTLHVNGSVAGTSAYNNLSDGSLKRNVANVPDALNKISQIRGVSFDWRKDVHPELNLGDRQELGVIAQEVEKVFPEAVSIDKTGIRSVAYSMLIAPLIEATKEVRSWLLNHDREIASLKEKNEELERKNQQLEAYLCAKDPHAPFCK